MSSPFISHFRNRIQLADMFKFENSAYQIQMYGIKITYNAVFVYVFIVNHA